MKDEKFTTFIAAPIIVDSCNFASHYEGEKWTAQDLEVYQKLQEHSDILKDDAFYLDLHHTKLDIQANLDLGLENILIKDFKKYTNYNISFGVSTVFVPAHLLREKYSMSDYANIITQHMKN